MPKVKRLPEALRQTLVRLYSPDGFRGSVITLLSGTGVALSIAYVTQPVLTRLYAPEAFGVSDYFGMLMTLFLTVASLRYEDAVMTPKAGSEARAVLRLALWLTCGWVVLLFIAALWSRTICTALGVPDLAPWFWLLPITLLLSKSARLLEVWLSRLKRFRPISVGQVASTSTTAGSRITAGIAAPTLGAGGLIAGVTAGHIVSAAILTPLAIRHTRSSDPPVEHEPYAVRTIARRYKRYAIYSMPASLLNALVTRLPIIVLPFYFSIGVVGLYGRAFVTLAVPLGLIGAAVAQVFFAHAGEARRAGTLSLLATNVHRRLVMVGVFPTLALMAAGPALFEFVFGIDWRPAGVYVQVLAPWLFLSAVAAPLTRIFDVLEKQRADFITSLAMSLLLAVALVIGGGTRDIGLTLLLLGIAGTLARLVHLWTLLYLAGVSLRGAVYPYARFALTALPLALLLAFLAPRIEPAFTLAATMGSAAAYYLVVLLRERII